MSPCFSSKASNAHEAPIFSGSSVVKSGMQDYRSTRFGSIVSSIKNIKDPNLTSPDIKSTTVETRPNTKESIYSTQNKLFMRKRS